MPPQANVAADVSYQPPAGNWRHKQNLKTCGVDLLGLSLHCHCGAAHTHFESAMQAFRGTLEESAVQFMQHYFLLIKSQHSVYLVKGIFIFLRIEKVKLLKTVYFSIRVVIFWCLQISFACLFYFHRAKYSLFQWGSVKMGIKATTVLEVWPKPSNSASSLPCCLNCPQFLPFPPL